MEEIQYDQLIENYGKNVLLVDLRSQAEYEESTIPGAINLPILTEDEHKEVSILYRQKQFDQAKALGVHYAAEKLSPYFEQIMAYQRNCQVALFCSRGGFRSRVLTQIFQALDIPVLRLDQGYKGYRKIVVENLEKEIAKKNYLVLDGFTGVGKTEILHALEEEGQGVIDLEGLANHRGSKLGDVGLGPQPSQKMFESTLYQALINTGDTVFIEGESSMIGKIHLPKLLKEKMKEAPHIYIKDSKERRLERLKKDYIIAPTEELVEVVSRFRGNMKDQNLDLLISQLEEGQVEAVVEELMGRYDKIYRYDTKKMSLTLENSNLQATVQALVAYKNQVEQAGFEKSTF